MPLEYVLAGALIFGVNLLPAFGPPTWAILVALRVHSDLAAVPLVAVGAIAAALGRFTLAVASRHLRRFMSPKRLESLAAAEQALTGSRGKAAAGLGLFALSPVPSAQLFVAAGLMTVPLVPLTLAFFAGRLVSYSIYVAGAGAAKETVGSALDDSLRAPLGIAIQLAMLIALVLLLRVDWAGLVARRHGSAHRRAGRG